MPHDRKRNPLKAGDMVTMRFRVAEVHQGETACNVTLVAVAPPGVPGEYVPTVACNARLTEVVAEDAPPAPDAPWAPVAILYRLEARASRANSRNKHDSGNPRWEDVSLFSVPAGVPERQRIDRAWALARGVFPPSEGWEEHEVSVSPLTGDLVVDAEAGEVRCVAAPAGSPGSSAAEPVGVT